MVTGICHPCVDKYCITTEQTGQMNSYSRSTVRVRSKITPTEASGRNRVEKISFGEPQPKET